MADFELLIEQMLGIAPLTQRRILASLAVLLIVWILYQIFLHTVIMRIENPQSRYQLRKTSGYLIFAISILIIGRIWYEGVQAFATFLGLLTAGLAIALKDPVQNFFGWIFIIWRRPFDVGDRVEIGDYAGDVIDLNVFQFTLMEIGNWVNGDQSTGRVLHVPNGVIFSQTIANFTQGSDYIWNEIPVLITFESNWEKAKAILEEIVDRHAQHLDVIEESFRKASRRLLLRYGTLTPIVYTSVQASGVLLTMRYLCPPRDRRGSSQEMWENILRAFGMHEDISLAYPTQRFYNQAVEGSREISEKD
jgi:small-conductance mechanosensitive channel